MTGIPKNKVVHPGTEFGSLTFLGYAKSKYGNAYGIFQCAHCGEIRERVVSHVRTGYVQSCHCQNAIRMTRHGHATNGTETPTYMAWAAMKKRCLDSNHRNFASYGGRGITVCERWLKFENFLSDMGDRPGKLSLDRIDNDRSYAPDNCRWATMRQQNNNKRSNSFLDFNGKSLTISQWSELTGIKDCTISERLRHGWSVDRTLTTPTRTYRAQHSAPPDAT